MKDQNLVNSVLKSLDVLKLVGDSDKGLRLSEIADTLNLKRPAAHNLVRTLMTRGFLEKHTDNRLYIGASFLEIAAHQLSKSLVRAAEQELLRLSAAYPGGVMIFGLATTSEIRQMIRVSADRPQVIQRLNGDGYHPYASASGLAGLAFLPESSLMQIEERYPFPEYGAHLWKSRSLLEAFLEGVRRDKVAVCPFDAERFYRVSVPIFDRAGHLTGVIGTSMPATLAEGDRGTLIRQELKQAAKHLEKE